MLAIMGPTAVGKTAVAEALADGLGVRLINTDAFLVYRGFDIGTAKPDRRELYDLIDLKEPHESFGVGEWIACAQPILHERRRQGQHAIFVGGTGLYVRALFEKWTSLGGPPSAELRQALRERLQREGLGSLVEELRAKDPQTTVDALNPVRVLRALERLEEPRTPLTIDIDGFSVLKVGIDRPVVELNRRIEERIDAMIQSGWMEEVTDLLQKGVMATAPAFRAIGYLALRDVVQGRTTLAAAKVAMVTETRRYAKRQRTWLRSEPDLIHRDISSESTQETVDWILNLIEDDHSDGQVN